MPSASSSVTGGGTGTTTTMKSGKQGSKTKNNKLSSNKPTGNSKLPTTAIEADVVNDVTEETASKLKIHHSTNNCTKMSNSGSGSKGGVSNSLPNQSITEDQIEQAGVGSTLEASLEVAVTTLFEHKIRNLDKRKAKLDTYKAEQANGKQLNPDQLQAVSKFSEVKSQLDFAKEMEKALKEMMDNYLASFKKQQMQEAVERVEAGLDKTKLILTFTSILRELRSEDARRDFTEGNNGAVKLTDEQLSCLNELQLATVDANLLDDNNVDVAAERLVNIIDERNKIVSGNMACKDAKNLLLELATSEYFKSASVSERARLKKELADREMARSMVSMEEQLQLEKEKAMLKAENARTFEESSAEVKDKLVSYERDGGSSFSYARDSQMDLTHVDPAVVAVSYTAPPPVSHENVINRFNSLTRAEQHGQVQHVGLVSHGGQGDVNLNNLASLKNDETIDNWTNPTPPTTNQESWSTLRDGTINVGLNESEGMEFEYQNRREGDRIQYQNRGRQTTNAQQQQQPVNNGYRGSPNQYQKPSGGGGNNVNGKTNDSLFDARPRYDRGDSNAYGDFRGQGDRGRGGERRHLGGFGNRNDTTRPDFMNHRYPPSMQGQGPRGGAGGGGRPAGGNGPARSGGSGGGNGGGSAFRGGNGGGGGMFQ